jgi:aspartyl-tRNA(Asn)/glutamyl-tRNA(Gln) amidotransferase subunit A
VAGESIFPAPTAKQITEKVQSGECSASRLTDIVLNHIRATDHEINAYITVDEDGARQQAEAIDRKIASGQPVGSLSGIPMGIKDVLCTKGLLTTCASKILGNFIPPYDATIVSHLRDADAVILGKLNMDEFAMGSSNENSTFGTVKNPHDHSRVAGGSSGGSAASVAAEEAFMALGSDTGGSIRQPASFCGTVGLKPTYGRVSRYGLIAYASSLDQAGPITRTVEDAALLLGVIAGHDPFDATSANVAVPDYTANLDRGVDGLTIGLPKEYFAQGLQDDVRQAVMSAVETLEKNGATIQEVSLPTAGQAAYAIATYYIIATAEASSNLSRFDGVRYGFRAEATNLTDMYTRSRSEGFGAEVKRRIMLGTYALSAGYYDAYYRKAQQVRTLIKQDFDNAFESCDLLASPVSPTPAFKIGEKTADPLQMYLSDIYTVSVNLAGIPGISVPCGNSSEGLPIGLQLLGNTFSEPTILQAAYLIEREGGQ